MSANSDNLPSIQAIVPSVDTNTARDPPLSDEARSTAADKVSISCFLDKINITIPNAHRDAEIRARVDKTIRAWGLIDKIHPHDITGIMIVETAYNYLSNIRVKMTVALFTALLTAMDDPEVLETFAPDEFHHAFFAGQIQNVESGMFGQLARNLGSMWDHFPRFSASGILACTLQFINKSILENMSQDVILSTTALPFVEYRRSMTGVAEAYAVCIWDKTRFPDVHVYIQVLPDVMLYINYVNDILSFYKEELEGETYNYIGDRAAVSGKTKEDTLRDVIYETVAAVHRIRVYLGAGEAREA